MIRDITVKEYECDACGRHKLVDEVNDPPEGIRLSWFEVSSFGGAGGELWLCSERCAVRAVKDRHEIERKKEEASRG